MSYPPPGNQPDPYQPGQPYEPQPPVPPEQPGPYAQPEPSSGQPGPYAQPEPSSGQPGPYGQPSPYGQPDPYGQPNPYGQYAQYGPGYPGYQAQPYGYAPARGTNTLAILALILGILIPPGGIVLGHIAKRQLRTSGEEGAGLATAGLVVGYVLTAAYVLFCCGAIGLGWLGATLDSNGTGSSY